MVGYFYSPQDASNDGCKLFFRCLAHAAVRHDAAGFFFEVVQILSALRIGKIFLETQSARAGSSTIVPTNKFQHNQSGAALSKSTSLIGIFAVPD